jgi:hypothetical protein
MIYFNGTGIKDKLYNNSCPIALIFCKNCKNLGKISWKYSFQFEHERNFNGPPVKMYGT